MPQLQSFTRKSPPHEELPPPREAPLTDDTYEQLAQGACFDVQISFHDALQWIAKQPFNQYTNVQVSTVRSGKPMLESPVGNLWWLAIALRCQLQQACVDVVDFYDDPTHSEDDIKALCDALKFDPEKTTLYRAEEFLPDAELFERLQSLVKKRPEVAEPMDFSKELRIPKPVQEGLRNLRDGKTNLAWEQLARLMEEMKVFLLSHNDQRQMLFVGHEVATVTLMRMMFELKKKIVCILSPRNEYRGQPGALRQLAGKCLQSKQEHQPGRRTLAVETAHMLAGCDQWILENDRTHYRNRSISLLGDLGDQPLMEYAEDIRTTASITHRLTQGELGENPEAISDFILSNHTLKTGGRPLLPTYLHAPFGALITKHRKNPLLLAGVFLNFLHSVADSPALTHAVIFNPLFDFLCKLSPAEQASCGDVLSALKAALRNILECVHTYAVNFVALGERCGVPFEQYERQLQSFLGSDVTFAAPANYQEQKLRQREVKQANRKRQEEEEREEDKRREERKKKCKDHEEIKKIQKREQQKNDLDRLQEERWG